MRLKSGIVGILFFLVINTGCQKEALDCSLTSQHTLIIYMGGDNNLSAETFEKLAAIQSFARYSDLLKTEKINILIYQDSKEQPKLYKGRYGASDAELLATYSRENSASSEVFQRVLQDCIRYAPAKSYGLIVFSHASGWLPEGTLNNPLGKAVSRSVIVDGTSEMDIKDFARAIPNGTFEYIVFEACFMAGVEVAYELKDKTDYIVGSAAEMLSSGFTEIYSEILSDLCNTSTSTEDRLINMAKTYFAYYAAQNGQRRSATISVIKTEKLDRLAQTFKIRIPIWNVNIKDIQHFDRNAYHLFFDLADYVTQSYDAAASTHILSAIDEVVVFKQATATFIPQYGGFAIRQHCGLTTYIKQEKFTYLNQQYANLTWSR